MTSIVHPDHEGHRYLYMRHDHTVYCGECHQDANQPRSWGIARLARIKALIAARIAREKEPTLW